MMQRLVWVDYVKVICIFLMVVCHIGGGKYFNPTLVYAFHMPAFFVMSGLLFRPKSVIQTLKAFIIPVGFCSIINVAYGLLPDVYHYATIGDIVSKLRNYAESFWMYKEGELFPGIWFIVSLFVIRLLFSMKCMFNHSLIIAIISALWMSASSFLDTSAVVDYHIYNVLGSIPFFVTGIMIRKHLIRFEKMMTVPFEVKITLFMVFVTICSIQGFCEIQGSRYGYNYLLYFINALIGTFLLICVCRTLPERRYIVLLSIGTFIILGFHRTLSSINVLFLFNPIGVNPEEYALLNTLLILLYLYWPIKFLLKHKPVLLGK